MQDLSFVCTLFITKWVGFERKQLIWAPKAEGKPPLI